VEAIFSLRIVGLKGRTISDLNQYELKVYSQNGEDGIIRAIFAKIGTSNRFCVEFGVEKGLECNTRYLRDRRGWNCVWMDAGDGVPEPIRTEFVTAENINSLFKKYDVPPDFDLLSIDIDGNDYWVWKALEGYTPRVVVIEYNSSLPPTESKVIPYQPGFVWDGTNYFGASLLALSKLGESKGYTLVCCEGIGVNAFFVKTELVPNRFAVRRIEEVYRRPRFGMKTKSGYIGHPMKEGTYLSA